MQTDFPDFGVKLRDSTIMSRLEAFYRQTPAGLTEDQIMWEIAAKIIEQAARLQFPLPRLKSSTMGER